MDEARSEGWLDEVAWNAEGLVPAVAQDATSGEVLMVAWMNREALARTVEAGDATYWSRSRRALWTKGETSGHFLKVREVRIDCDADTILLMVDSVAGVACHTGRRRCLFRVLEGAAGERRWRVTDPVVEAPRGHG